MMRRFENDILNYGVTYPNRIGVRAFVVGGCDGSAQDTRFNNMRITKIGLCRQCNVDTNICSISNCRNAVWCGGHMVFLYNRRRYLCIVPICRGHNDKKFDFDRGERLYLKDGYPVIIIPWW